MRFLKAARELPIRIWIIWLILSLAIIIPVAVSYTWSEWIPAVIISLVILASIIWISMEVRR